MKEEGTLEITELHLWQAVEETKLFKEAWPGGSDLVLCHCVVANAIADHFGQPVVRMSVDEARLSDSSKIYLDHTKVEQIYDLEHTFDRGNYSTCVHMLPLSVSYVRTIREPSSL